MKLDDVDDGGLGLGDVIIVVVLVVFLPKSADKTFMFEKELVRNIFNLKKENPTAK